MQDPMPPPDLLHPSVQKGWLDDPTETMAAPSFDDEEADSPWAPSIRGAPSIPIFCSSMTDEIVSSLAPHSTHDFPFEESVVSAPTDAEGEEVISSCTVGMASLIGAYEVPSTDSASATPAAAKPVVDKAADAAPNTESMLTPALQSVVSVELVRPNYTWHAFGSFAALAVGLAVYVALITTMVTR
jgi:hypothetical protein